MGTYVEPHRPKPYGSIYTASKPPDPPKEPDVSFIPVNRGDIFETLKWLRGEVYPGLVGHPLDDEGIAAWLCDNYIRYRQTMGHVPAQHRVFADIQAVVSPNQPPPVGPPPTGRVLGPIGVNGRDFTVPDA
jgi:hypothetical protein